MAKRKFSEYDPEKVACWSPMNSIGPHEASYSSKFKYWFDCDKCPHSFLKNTDVITDRGVWCPYCANQSLCSDEDCETCHEKTFAFHCPERAAHWSSKNSLKANQVFQSSGKKYLHDCAECGHEFSMSPSSIQHKGTWCNFCANRARCPEEKNCETCFSKTFACYDSKKVSCWSPKNKCRPYDLALASHKRAYFDCGKCHRVFSNSIDKITLRSYWCPRCKTNKCVDSLSDSLETWPGVSYRKEVSVKCEGRNLNWDVVVDTPHGEFHIESDGPQHFSVRGTVIVSRGNSKNVEERFACQRIRDLLKEDHIRNSGGLLFRVSYRQLHMMDELVDKMLDEIESGTKGVIYMDSIYTDWYPIE